MHKRLTRGQIQSLPGPLATLKALPKVLALSEPICQFVSTLPLMSANRCARLTAH